MNAEYIAMEKAFSDMAGKVEEWNAALESFAASLNRLADQQAKNRARSLFATRPQ